MKMTRIRELWCALIHFGHTPGPKRYEVGARTVRRCTHCRKILEEEMLTNVAAAKQELFPPKRGRVRR